MADKKISALTASSTPLAGTEVLPIVQSGATVQVSVENLTAGRAISATQLTLTTGNVIVANGQGVDFSATPSTGTSELFADYEEGTWTPNQGAGLTVVGTFSSQGTYTKIGRMVYITGRVTGSTSISIPLADFICTNLPFSIGAAGVGSSITSAVNQYAGTLAFSGASLYGTPVTTPVSFILFSVAYPV